MGARILQAARHLRRHDVPRDPHDKQFAKPRIKNPLGRHTRITATQDRREGMLAPGQFGQGLPRQARHMRFALQEPFVAVDQALEGFVGGNVGLVSSCFPITASIT